VADRDLAAIALKCLEKEPPRRYESAAALADDLDRWLAGEATHARPLSLVSQAWRWLKRHTGAASLVVVVGLVWGVAVGLTDYGGGGEHQLFPDRPTSPLGLYRAAHSSVWSSAALVLIAVGMSLGVGWLVVRVARPKTARGAFGYAAATGFIAVCAAFLLEAPFLAERAADGSSFHVHPIADGAGPPTPDERAYLNQYLPPDADADEVLRVTNEARRVNRLNEILCGLWIAVAGSLVLHLGTAGLETWVAYRLDRAWGRRWWTLVPYLEIVVPGSLALITLIGVVLQGLSEDLVHGEVNPTPVPLMVSVIVWLASLAAVAVVGIVRGWPWWVRLLLYVATAFAWFAGLVVMHAVGWIGE
jgi:hypothetical protein